MWFQSCVSWIRTHDPNKYMKKSDWLWSFPLFGQLFEMLQPDWLSLYYSYTRLAAQGGMAVSEYTLKYRLFKEDTPGVYFWK